jgi:tRNA dimethylallyltransferase
VQQPNDKIKVAVLLGPTAAGKTELALRLANDLHFDIVSCDSRQIYRGMDIGTSKPCRENLTNTRHWLIDIMDPSQAYSAYQFSLDATTIIRRLAREGKKTLLCGGTGLYYKCLSQGMGPHAPADARYRAELQESIRNQGMQNIYAQLQTIDPVSADRIRQNDAQRIIRALEVFHCTGIPSSHRSVNTGAPDDIDFNVFKVMLPRQLLYERINGRVDFMLRNGLWEEYCRLRAEGFEEKSPGMQCVGYKELFAVERKQMTLAVASDKIKQNTRRYAKRQITWFTHQVSGNFMDLSNDCYPSIIQEISNYFTL